MTLPWSDTRQAGLYPLVRRPMAPWPTNSRCGTSRASLQPGLVYNRFCLLSERKFRFGCKSPPPERRLVCQLPHVASAWTRQSRQRSLFAWDLRSVCHTLCHCGTSADARGLNALVSDRASGRFARHQAVTGRLHGTIVGPTGRSTQATFDWSVRPVGQTGRTDCSRTAHICQSNHCGLLAD